MAKTAVAELHARLVADVTQYDAEMKRAAAVTQQAAGKIDAQMGELQRNVARKFSLPDVGKDILRGLGIGGGFQAAETFSAKVVEYYKEQAEFAKAIEESTARTLESTKRMIAMDQTPEQQAATIEREFQAKGRELENAQRPQEQLVDRYVLGVKIGQDRVAQPFTDEQRLRIQKLAEEYQLLGEAVKKARNAVDEAQKRDKQRQDDLRVQEINLDGGRPAAASRYEITGNEEAVGRNIVRQMQQERTQNAERFADRIAREGLPRVDDMTRRGMGVGADYSGWTKSVATLLREISETLRRIERTPASEGI